MNLLSKLLQQKIILAYLEEFLKIINTPADPKTKLTGLETAFNTYQIFSCDHPPEGDLRYADKTFFNEHGNLKPAEELLKEDAQLIAGNRPRVSGAKLSCVQKNELPHASDRSTCILRGCIMEIDGLFRVRKISDLGLAFKELRTHLSLINPFTKEDMLTRSSYDEMTFFDLSRCIGDAYSEDGLETAKFMLENAFWYGLMPIFRKMHDQRIGIEFPNSSLEDNEQWSTFKRQLKQEIAARKAYVEQLQHAPKLATAVDLIASVDTRDSISFQIISKQKAIASGSTDVKVEEKKDDIEGAPDISAYGRQLQQNNITSILPRTLQQKIIVVYLKEFLKLISNQENLEKALFTYELFVDRFHPPKKGDLCYADEVIFDENGNLRPAENLSPEDEKHIGKKRAKTCAMTRFSQERGMQTVSDRSSCIIAACNMEIEAQLHGKSFRKLGITPEELKKYLQVLRLKNFYEEDLPPSELDALLSLTPYIMATYGKVGEDATDFISKNALWYGLMPIFREMPDTGLERPNSGLGKKNKQLKKQLKKQLSDFKARLKQEITERETYIKELERLPESVASVDREDLTSYQIMNGQKASASAKVEVAEPHDQKDDSAGLLISSEQQTSRHLEESKEEIKGEPKKAETDHDAQSISAPSDASQPLPAPQPVPAQQPVILPSSGASQSLPAPQPIPAPQSAAQPSTAVAPSAAPSLVKEEEKGRREKKDVDKAPSSKTTPLPEILKQKIILAHLEKFKEIIGTPEGISKCLYRYQLFHPRPNAEELERNGCIHEPDYAAKRAKLEKKRTEPNYDYLAELEKLDCAPELAYADKFAFDEKEGAFFTLPRDIYPAPIIIDGKEQKGLTSDIESKLVVSRARSRLHNMQLLRLNTKSDRLAAIIWGYMLVAQREIMITSPEVGKKTRLADIASNSRNIDMEDVAFLNTNFFWYGLLPVFERIQSTHQGKLITGLDSKSSSPADLETLKQQVDKEIERRNAYLEKLSAGMRSAVSSSLDAVSCKIIEMANKIMQTKDRAAQAMFTAKKAIKNMEATKGEAKEAKEIDEKTNEEVNKAKIIAENALIEAEKALNIAEAADAAWRNADDPLKIITGVDSELERAKKIAKEANTMAEEAKKMMDKANGVDVNGVVGDYFRPSKYRYSEESPRTYKTWLPWIGNGLLIAAGATGIALTATGVLAPIGIPLASMAGAGVFAASAASLCVGSTSLVSKPASSYKTWLRWIGEAALVAVGVVGIVLTFTGVLTPLGIALTTTAGVLMTEVSIMAVAAGAAEAVFKTIAAGFRGLGKLFASKPAVAAPQQSSAPVVQDHGSTLVPSGVVQTAIGGLKKAKRVSALLDQTMPRPPIVPSELPSSYAQMNARGIGAKLPASPPTASPQTPPGQIAEVMPAQTLPISIQPAADSVPVLTSS